MKFLLRPPQLPPRLKTKQQKEKKNPAATYLQVVWNKTWWFPKPCRDQDSMRVASLTAWEQQHLTVSSPAAQRITHRGGWACLVVTLTKGKHSEMGSCFRSLIPLAVIYITIFHPKTQCMYCGFETMSAAFPDQTSNYWFILILYITALLYPFSQMAKSAALHSGQFAAACRCNGMHACMAKWWESLTWVNLLLHYNINMHDVY